jgi:hypothetical protein
VTQVEDFFNLTEDHADPKRDGGMPQLIPKGLEGTGVRSKYNRASGLADLIDTDKYHIHRWEMRYLAKGMGRRPDLCDLAAVETYSTGVLDATFGQDKQQSGRRLDGIIVRALDHVGIHSKADRGTTVHMATEPGSVPIEDVPKHLQSPTRAWWEFNRVNAINLEGTEVFTANDITMSAGTFDHLVTVPGHPLLTDYVVSDKKTGKYEPFHWAVQIASYAYGDVYDTTNDTRPAWPGPINLKWALVWQIDCDPATPEDQRITPHIVDLEFGWEMAQLAAKNRDAHKRRDIAAPMRPATFAQKLEASNTPEALRRLWYSTTDPAEIAAINSKGASL